MLQYYNVLAKQVDEDLQQFAAAKIDGDPSVGITGRVDPTFWTKVGHRMLFSRGITRPYKAKASKQQNSNSKSKSNSNSKSNSTQQPHQQQQQQKLSKTYKQLVWQAAGLAGLLFEYV